MAGGWLRLDRTERAPHGTLEFAARGGQCGRSHRTLGTGIAAGLLRGAIRIELESPRIEAAYFDSARGRVGFAGDGSSWVGHGSTRATTADSGGNGRPVVMGLGGSGALGSVVHSDPTACVAGCIVGLSDKETCPIRDEVLALVEFDIV